MNNVVNSPFESQRFELLLADGASSDQETQLAFVGTWNAAQVVLDRVTGQPARLSFMPRNCFSDAELVLFERETQTLSTIECPQFLNPYEYAVEGDWVYVATRVVLAHPLDTETIVSLSLERILEISIDILDALICIHQNGINHRNIRASSILIGRNRTYLTGVGPERFADNQFLHPSQVNEISETMAPELAGTLEYDVGPTADLYSFGTFLFQLLTGKVPYQGPSAGETLFNHLTCEPEVARIRNDAPTTMREVVLKLLQKDPQERYQLAESVRHDLTHIKNQLANGQNDNTFIVGQTEAKPTIMQAKFVGCENELSQLLNSLELVVGGQNCNVVIAAPTGMGKSRMITEFHSRATKQNVKLLRCEGVNQVNQEPMAAIRDLVSGVLNWVQTMPEVKSRLKSKLASHLSDIASISPELAAELGYVKQNSLANTKGPKEFGSARVRAVVCKLLDSIASPQFPVIIWFDHCQWLDKQTRRILQDFVAMKTGNTFSVFSIRSDDPKLASRFTARINPDHLFELGTLTDLEVKSLVNSMAGGIPDEAANTVIKFADGSPLMASAILRGLIESEAISRIEGDWKVDPERLAEHQMADDAAALLLLRLEKLPADTLSLLSAAAIIGKEFLPEDAIAISDSTLKSQLPFEAARNNRIIWRRPEGMLKFTHDTLREALLKRLAKTDKRKLHNAYANLLERTQPDNPFQLAYHFHQAKNPKKALHFAIKSAAIARQQFSLNSAEAQLKIAAANLSHEPDDSPVRFEIYSALGDTLMLDGRYDEAAGWMKRAKSLAHTPLQSAGLRLDLGELEFKVGNKAAAVAHFEEALAELGYRVPKGKWFWLDLFRELALQFLHTAFPKFFVGVKTCQPNDESRLAWRTFSRLAHGYWYTSNKFRTLFAHIRGLNLAEKHVVTRELAQCYSEHAPALSLIPWHGRGLKYAERSLQMRQELGDLWGQGQSRNFISIVHYSNSNFEDAFDEAEQAIAILDRTGDYWELGIARYHATASLFRQGKLREALDKAQLNYHAALKVGDLQSSGNILDVWVRAGMGLIPKDVVERESQRDISDRQTKCQILLALGISNLHDAEYDKAIESFQEAIEISKKSGLLNTYVATNYVWYATALRHKLENRPPRLQSIKRKLTRQFNQAAKSAVRVARKYKNDLPHALRELSLSNAQAGRMLRAKKCIDASVNVAQSQGAEYELLQSQLVYGEIGTEFNWDNAKHVFEQAQQSLEQLESQIKVKGNIESLSLQDRFDTLLNAGRKIATAPTREAIYEQTKEAAKQLLRGQRALLVHVNPENRFQPSPEFFNSQFDESLFQLALNAGHPHTSDVEVAKINDALQERKGSYIAVPVLVNESIKTVLYVGNDFVQGLFREDECKIATYLAAATGAALERADGFQKLEHMNTNLERLVDQRTKAAEARSLELEHTTDVLRTTQSRLEKAKDSAEAANQAKGSFLAMMSHEIRTPISAVLGYTEMILNDLQSEPSVTESNSNVRKSSLEQNTQRLKTIHRSGKHLLGLINDILDLSKIDAGKMEIEIIHCSPLTIASQVIDSFALKAKEAGIGLNLIVDGQIPETIHSDPTRLQQILMNLVGNAVKFTPEGTVDLSMRFSKKDSSLVFDVADSGIGMSQEQTGKVFDQFSQAESSTARKYGGTGLGLAISKRLALALGGDICVSSVPGEGSKFSVSIATGDVTGVPMVDQVNCDQEAKQMSFRYDKVDLSGRRFLIVDDAETNREFIAYILNTAGAQTETCEDGQEALDRIAVDADFDVVLMDMQMPGLDGISTTKILRESGLTTPIIALTANTLKSDERKCLDAGCDRFVTKPIDVNQFLKLLAKMLRDSPLVFDCKASQKKLKNEPSTNSPTTPALEPIADEEIITEETSAAETSAAETSVQLPPLMIKKLTDRLHTGIENRLPETSLALRDADTEVLVEFGHWLKGSASTIGLSKLAAQGGTIESSAKEKNLAGCELALELVKQALALHSP